MNVKLLEDKLHHCQENLNFVANELLKHKGKKARFTTLDRVIQWETDYHYRIGNPIEINYEQKETTYYVRWERSTLCGAYKYDNKSWAKESNLFGNISELKQYLKDRINSLVCEP